MPHLQTLVERHNDDPFVLIGVNTGDSPEKYRAGIEKYGVTWISAYQGDSNPIADLYKVEGYPTYVLVDSTGKIRNRGHSSQALDSDIAKLVEEAKKSSAE